MKNEVFAAKIAGIKLSPALLESNKEARNDGKYHVTVRINFDRQSNSEEKTESRFAGVLSKVSNLSKRFERLENDSAPLHCLEFADLFLEDSELKECGFNEDEAPTDEVQKKVGKKMSALLRDENEEFISYVFSYAEMSAKEVLAKAGRDKGLKDGKIIEFETFYSTEQKRAYPFIYVARIGQRDTEYMERRLSRACLKAITRLEDGKYLPGEGEADQEAYLSYMKAQKAESGKSTKELKPRKTEAEPDDDLDL